MVRMAATATVLAGAMTLGTSAQAEFKTEVYLDYNVELVHDDHANLKTSDNTPTKSTTFDNTTYLGFAGTDGKKVSWSVYALISGADTDWLTRFEDASVTYRLNKMISFQVGHQYLLLGGHEWKNFTYDIPFANVYMDNMALPGSATAYTAILNFGKNTVSIQFADDVDNTITKEDGTTSTCADECYFNSTRKQPAVLIEYSGNFGKFNPLLQITSYDGLNHSRAITAGVGFDVAGLSGYVDFTSDSRVKQVLATGKEKTTTFTSTNLYAKYDAGKVAPFLKVATYDVEQEPTDIKYNSSAAKYDDNQVAFAMGVDLKFKPFGDQFTPYVMYRSISGDIQDATDTSKEETKTQSQIVLGVMGTLSN